MTFGSLAGLMIAEEIVGEKSPWRELFSPHRRNVLAGAWDYLRENLDYPYYMVKDRIMRQESTSLQQLAPEEAAILRISGRRVAAYRGEDGRLYAVSPTCTHLGCHVHWNTAEKTWDCPCHGSRYAPDGKVIAGPAQRPLQPIEVNASSHTLRPPEERGSQWSIAPNM
jgi:Rieske Fe-S protein